MKAPITLIALAFMLGLTYPLQCMETPLLSDRLGTLRTNLDTLKKSLSKLKQRLEALKEALKKPSGAGFGGGGPGGGGPGGDDGNGGGTPTSKPFMPFESLPEELNKEIMSFVLKSDIKFNFTDSKSLYNSIKAAGRKISTIRLLSKYYAEQYKMSVVIRIICPLLTKQLEREGKTLLDVPSSNGLTILDLAIEEKNVVICKIILIVDPQVAGPNNQNSIVTYNFTYRLSTALDWADPELRTMILKVTNQDTISDVVHSFVAKYPEKIDELLAYINDNMRLLFEGLYSLSYQHTPPSRQAIIKIVNIILQKIKHAKSDEEKEALLAPFNIVTFCNAVGLDGCIDLLNTLQDAHAITLPAPMKRLLPGILHYAIRRDNLLVVQKTFDAVGEDKKQTLWVNYCGRYKLLADIFHFENEPLHPYMHSPTDLGVLLELFKIGGDKIEQLLLSDRKTIIFLHQAINDDNLECVQELLKALGDSAVIVIRSQDNFANQNKDGKTVLQYAVEKGNPDIVQAILDALGDRVSEILDLTDFHKALKTVVQKRNPKIIEALLVAAGDHAKNLILLPDKDGENILQWVAKFSSPAIMQVILKEADVDGDFVTKMDKKGMTALADAIAYKNFPMVELFLTETNKNTIQKIRQLALMKDKIGKTVLHYEHSLDNPQIVTLILKSVGGQKKNLVTTKDIDGNTILHGLTNKTSPDAVKAVLEAAGDKAKDLVTTTNKYVKTVLHYKYSLDNPEIVTLILNAAGDQKKNLVTTKDFFGNTILHSLSNETSLDALQIVLEAAGDKVMDLLTAKDNGGNTILHTLVNRTRLDVLKAILEAAGDKAEDLVTTENKQGKTPLYYSTPSTEELFESYTKK